MMVNMDLVNMVSPKIVGFRNHKKNLVWWLGSKDEKFCWLFLPKLFYCPVERGKESRTCDLCGQVIAGQNNCVALRNFSWLKSLSQYCMYWQFTFSTGMLSVFHLVKRSRLLATLSENMKVISANIFHRRQKLLLAVKGKEGLIPDLEFREGPQILPQHQLLSYIYANSTCCYPQKTFWKCETAWDWVHTAQRAKIEQSIQMKSWRGI